VLRTNNGRPPPPPIVEICALTVDCVEFSRLAALVSPPLSATATKLRSSQISNIAVVSAGKLIDGVVECHQKYSFDR
jgi:hypothetical protein